MKEYIAIMSHSCTGRNVRVVTSQWKTRQQQRLLFTSLDKEGREKRVISVNF